MTCYKEEIFGPVLITMNVDTLDDVMFKFQRFKFRFHFYQMTRWHSSWRPSDQEAWAPFITKIRISIIRIVCHTFLVILALRIAL